MNFVFLSMIYFAIARIEYYGGDDSGWKKWFYCAAVLGLLLAFGEAYFRTYN